MKIRLISDLHLELYDRNLNFKTSAEVCVIAGDLGNPFNPNYEEALRKISNSHSFVVIISGNHEYYQRSKTMRKTENKIRLICQQFDNVKYLQKESVVYKNIKFIGCTLWANPDPSDKEMYYMSMKDQLYIKNLDFDKFVCLYNKHSKYLIKSLSIPSNEKVVVITHHLPSSCLIDEKFQIHPLNCFFASDVIDEIDLNNVQVWMYGHTHTSRDIILKNSTRFVCNPWGHIYEDSKFDIDKIIII